jgi:hypothetical protein
MLATFFVFCGEQPPLLPLCHQKNPEFGGKEKFPALFILGFPRLEANPPGLKIHLRPLAGNVGKAPRIYAARGNSITNLF